MNYESQFIESQWKHAISDMKNAFCTGFHNLSINLIHTQQKSKLICIYTQYDKIYTGFEMWLDMMRKNKFWISTNLMNQSMQCSLEIFYTLNIFYIFA